jgi:hypothetical protein
LQAIDAIFQSIKEAALERALQGWINRLAQCRLPVGDFVESTQESLRMIQALLDQFRNAN